MPGTESPPASSSLRPSLSLPSSFRLVRPSEGRRSDQEGPRPAPRPPPRPPRPLRSLVGRPTDPPLRPHRRHDGPVIDRPLQSEPGKTLRALSVLTSTPLYRFSDDSLVECTRCSRLLRPVSPAILDPALFPGRFQRVFETRPSVRIPGLSTLSI